MLNRESEYVAAIAQEGTLSGAAMQLGVSQPALTRFLKKEEAELGTALFQRINSRMVLTYAGECYLDYIEQIFSLPGLGQYTLTGINQRDYPVVQGCVLFIAFLYVIINVLVDILYTYIDPRITYN